MSRSRRKKWTRKIGLPEGSLVYLGDEPQQQATISILRYDERGIEEKTLTDISKCKDEIKAGGVTWIHIAGISDVSSVQIIGRQFDLHYLTLEDIVSSVHRPKIEEYPNYIYIVANHIRVPDGSFQLLSEQVSIIVGKNFVLSFEEGEADFHQLVLARLKKSTRHLKLGADFLSYIILDTLTDTLFGTLEYVGDQSEILEEEVINNPSPETLSNIYVLKRSLLVLRRVAWPLREVLNTLNREDSPLIQTETRLHFRDIYDHIVEVIDIIESIRDMASGVLDVYLSSVNNRMNSIMKVLTVITTIFMPLTFIAGVYGMNFEHMPELHWEYGYPFILGIMLAITIAMVVMFRKKNWL